MLLREIRGFGTILVHVVELPLVLVEVPLAGEWRVYCSGLPAFFPDTPRTEHRVVLALLLRRRVWLGSEGVAHRHARQRVLLDAAIFFRHLEFADIEDGRDDVRRVVVLIAERALCLDAFGPCND